MIKRLKGISVNTIDYVKDLVLGDLAGEYLSSKKNSIYMKDVILLPRLGNLNVLGFDDSMNTSDTIPLRSENALYTTWTQDKLPLIGLYGNTAKFDLLLQSINCYDVKNISGISVLSDETIDSHLSLGFQGQHKSSDICSKIIITNVEQIGLKMYGTATHISRKKVSSLYLGADFHSTFGEDDLQLNHSFMKEATAMHIDVHNRLYPLIRGNERREEDFRNILTISNYRSN